MLIRADGYLLLLTPRTAFTSNLADSSLHGLQTNTWITYHGVRQPNGMILVDTASVKNNEIAAPEDHLLGKSKYDPEKVDPKSKQSGVSKYFLGIDPKKIAPYPDEAMQSRIERIGNSLIPAYQKALPESDKTKIVFRFQLIDEKKWHGSIGWPSGVILVPRQAVEHLPNDSQLAALLADNIAVALEKQTLRRQPSKHKMDVASIAGGVGGLFVPGLGLATDITNAKIAEAIELRNEEQSGRVSLTLLSDAGYDIQQAPLAWWRIWAKDPDKLVESPLPPRAVNLYWTLGNIWHTPADAP